jgi:hypothetical protein
MTLTGTEVVVYRLGQKWTHPERQSARGASVQPSALLMLPEGRTMYLLSLVQLPGEEGTEEIARAYPLAMRQCKKEGAVHDRRKSAAQRPGPKKGNGAETLGTDPRRPPIPPASFRSERLGTRAGVSRGEQQMESGFRRRSAKKPITQPGESVALSAVKAFLAASFIRTQRP